MQRKGELAESNREVRNFFLFFNAQSVTSFDQNNTKIDRETHTSRTAKTHVNLTTMRQFQKVTGFVRTDRELLKKD